MVDEFRFFPDLLLIFPDNFFERNISDFGLTFSAEGEKDEEEGEEDGSSEKSKTEGPTVERSREA